MATQVVIGVSKAGITVHPESVTVTVRDAVEWLVIVERGLQPVRVIVYFHHGMPFQWERKAVEFKTAQDLSHSASIADVPTTPGKYKYGVRAEDLASKKTLADDDPYLNVLP